ncbi:hypothetical protein [Arcobacter sp. F2176]|uniref:hypothetical protein n=1 Tax=Arcobacter sp. F2176 TaxID=2044511 RepID=UPI00100AD77F|nr:hypothetical protein [Arcobacter sp. F2176]
MKNNIILWVCCIILISLTGCQRQIPKKEMQVLENKRIGILSEVRNTILIREYNGFHLIERHKSIADWNVNQNLEKFIFDKLKTENKYKSINILKRSEDIILHEDGFGKGVPTLFDIAKKEKLDYLIYIRNFWENKRYPGGLTFYKYNNIMDDKATEYLYLNLYLSISKVGDKKLNSLYFIELDKTQYLYKEYIAEKESLFMKKDINTFHPFINDTLHKIIQKHLLNAGLIN